MTWNADVYGTENYTASDFDSENNTDTLLCDLQRTDDSNMSSLISYTESTARRLRATLTQGPPPPSGGPPDTNGGTSSGSSMTTMSGIALTGGSIFNGLAGGNVDAVEGEIDTLDSCLSHTSPNG